MSIFAPLTIGKQGLLAHERAIGEHRGSGSIVGVGDPRHEIRPDQDRALGASGLDLSRSHR